MDEFSERVAEAWPMKCSYVVKELLQTERVYVQDLGEIIKVCVCVFVDLISVVCPRPSCLVMIMIH